MLGQTARNSALLSMAALASRLLGWVRLVVLVAAFGADGRLDPYLAAFKVPDIVYQLIAAGPLSSVLVPLVVRLRNENDEPRARQIMSAVFLVFGLLAIVIAAAALLFAGVLADLLAPGTGADQRDEVAHLSQLLAPSSLGLGIVAVASVWSASRERFFASSIGPLLYNLSVILFTIVGAKSLGTSAAALGTVVGALLFALIAVLDAWIGGLRFSRPGLGDALLRRSLVDMLPRIGGLLAVQVVLAGLVALASTLGPGSITAWSFALSLVQLPLAMVAGSIGTALLPVAARVVSVEGPAGLLRVARTSLGASVWMLVPVAVIGAALAMHPVELVLGISATSPVGGFLFSGLWLLLLSLPIQGTTSVATRLCYGAGDTRGPVLSGLVGSLLIAVSAAPLVGTLGFPGLAAAVLFGEAVETLLLLVRLRRHLRGSLLGEFASMFASSLLCGVVALASALLAAVALERATGAGAPTLRAASDACAAAVGLLVYLVVSARFKAPGSDVPIGAIRRAVGLRR